MPDSLTYSYSFLCTSDIRYTGVTTGLSVTAGAMSHAYKQLSKVDRLSLTKYLANSSTTHCPLSNRHKQSHGEPVELFTPQSAFQLLRLGGSVTYVESDPQAKRQRLIGQTAGLFVPVVISSRATGE